MEVSSAEEEGSPASLQPTQHPSILPFWTGACSQRRAAYALLYLQHSLVYSALCHVYQHDVYGF